MGKYKKKLNKRYLKRHPPKATRREVEADGLKVFVQDAPSEEKKEERQAAIKDVKFFDAFTNLIPSQMFFKEEQTVAGLTSKVAKKFKYHGKFDPKEAEHESLMGKIQQHRGEALTKKQRKWIENGEIDPLKPTHPAGVLALLLKNANAEPAALENVTVKLQDRISQMMALKSKIGGADQPAAKKRKTETGVENKPLGERVQARKEENDSDSDESEDESEDEDDEEEEIDQQTPTKSPKQQKGEKTQQTQPQKRKRDAVEAEETESTKQANKKQQQKDEESDSDEEDSGISDSESEPESESENEDEDEEEEENTTPSKKSSKSTQDKEVEENIQFGTFDFSSDKPIPAYLAQKKGRKVSDAELLRLVQQENLLVNELKNSQEGRDLLKKIKWDKALLKATGTKVKDDEKLLRKSVKRRRAAKEKSKKEWEERQKKQDQEREKRQEKRTQNIKDRNQAKKDKRQGKKTKRAGFEGRKKEFLNKNQK